MPLQQQLWLVRVSLPYHSSFRFLCIILYHLPSPPLPSFTLPLTTAPLDNAGSPLYVLDLTPVYRTFPRLTRLGLDHRLASWHGIPEVQEGCSAACREALRRRNISSQALPVPPWEAALFPAAAQPFEGARPAACAAAPLRWRVVHAIGRHLQWSPQGLHIMLPPKELSYALYKEELPQQYYAAYAAEYPLLVVGDGGAVVQQLEGAQRSTTEPLGMTGRLGWLGAPSIAVMGVGILTQLSDGIQTLDLLATVPPSAAEAVWRQDERLQPGALDQLPPEDSALLDDELVFWGQWADADYQQGMSPPSLSGARSAEVPLSLLGVPTLSDAIPSHPLALYSNASDPLAAVPPAYTPSPSLCADLAAVGLACDDTPGKAAAMAAEGWAAVVATSSFGSTVQSYDVALLAPGGFAHWPGTTHSLLLDVYDDLHRETVVMIPGGCLFEHRSFFGLMFCGYVSCGVL